MGPNPLWLAEFLSEPFELKPGMRVLDLGCGKGITSVFLAHEYGVQVYAVDFDEWGWSEATLPARPCDPEGWTSPDVRWDNAKEHDVEHLIVPIKADARKLPFAKDFFDAIICVDSYFYYGKEDGDFENIIQFLRPGGKIGMVIPGYAKDVSDGVPSYIPEFLGDELWTWETLSWWKNHWDKTGFATIDIADTLPNGCELWLRFDEAIHAFGPPSKFPDETDIFKTDLENGEYIGFIRLIATKKEMDTASHTNGG